MTSLLEIAPARVADLARRIARRAKTFAAISACLLALLLGLFLIAVIDEGTLSFEEVLGMAIFATPFSVATHVFVRRTQRMRALVELASTSRGHRFLLHLSTLRTVDAANAPLPGLDVNLSTKQREQLLS